MHLSKMFALIQLQATASHGLPLMLVEFPESWLLPKRLILFLLGSIYSYMIILVAIL